MKSEDGSGNSYLRLNSHHGTDTVATVNKRLEIGDLLVGYKGPEVRLDFCKQGELIGIEISETPVSGC